MQVLNSAQLPSKMHLYNDRLLRQTGLRLDADWQRGNGVRGLRHCVLERAVSLLEGSTIPYVNLKVQLGS